ncbi:hypothetical protein Hanom_Chr09g00864661 [Helianthus anomalus]
MQVRYTCYSYELIAYINLIDFCLLLNKPPIIITMLVNLSTISMNLHTHNINPGPQNHH